LDKIVIETVKHLSEIDEAKLLAWLRAAGMRNPDPTLVKSIREMGEQAGAGTGPLMVPPSKDKEIADAAKVAEGEHAIKAAADDASISVAAGAVRAGQGLISATGDTTKLVTALGKVDEERFDNVSGGLEGLGKLAGSVADSIAKILGSAPAIDSVTGGVAAHADLPPPLATGGLIRGPGTGTSDSIIGRLSNGEFVVNAAATSGNLSALHAINSGFRLPGFAFGGLVSTDPGWQGPGRKASTDPGRAVHLHLGGMTFELRAPTQVVASLEHTAKQSQMLSAGRRPSWVGG
jgi:hypothetical protein